MSQRDGFAGGFLLGTIVGGVVGGFLGAWVAKRSQETKTEKPSLLESGKAAKFNVDQDMEFARRSLEDKIAQLNLAIDDVRQQLGSVNGNGIDLESD
jgi:phage tail tape-measure protein